MAYLVTIVDVDFLFGHLVFRLLWLSNELARLLFYIF
jgi:hypothetical protein